jgi:3-oxoacyl-[acyl-carrier-protein] synthase II
MELKRVVVTGVGAITPLGHNVADTWAAILAGKSGAAPITHFNTEKFKTHFACEVKDFDPKQYIDRKEANKMDLYTQYAMVAATEAVEDTGLNIEQADKNRIGVVLGVGIGGTANVAANLAKEAACLRTVGSKHPDPMFAKIEEDLYKALNSLGIGILGAGGDTSVLAVNVEYAYTHIAGIACATSTNCMVARRASSRIDADGRVTAMKSPNWFGDR